MSGSGGEAALEPARVDGKRIDEHKEDRHQEAIKAYDRALEDDDLKDPSDAYFWLAISHMQISNWDLATSAFRSAAKFDEKMAKQSRQYIRYIAGEKRRLAALKEMLEG